MLKVKCGMDNIEIRFDHKFCEPDEIESLTGICVDEDRRCSLATVSLNGKQICCGMAICNPIDNFCRSTGRKKALADALYIPGVNRKFLPPSLWFNKEMRTAIWREYEAMCGF